MELLNYRDKVCVVTGAASGIEKAVCQQLVELGAKVYDLDQNEAAISELSGTSKEFDIRIEFVPDAVNASDVVRRFWRNFELVPKVADMVVDCSVGVVSRFSCHTNSMIMS